MIGLGKWGCHVDTMFFKGDVEITISDNNGQYALELFLPDIDIPEYTVKSVDEDGNTLHAVVNVSMLGKDVDVTVTFEADSFSGIIKIPFLGKIKLKDGFRIA